MAFPNGHLKLTRGEGKIKDPKEAAVNSGKEGWNLQCRAPLHPLLPPPGLFTPFWRSLLPPHFLSPSGNASFSIPHHAGLFRTYGLSPQLLFTWKFIFLSTLKGVLAGCGILSWHIFVAIWFCLACPLSSPRSHCVWWELSHNARHFPLPQDHVLSLRLSACGAVFLYTVNIDYFYWLIKSWLAISWAGRGQAGLTNKKRAQGRRRAKPPGDLERSKNMLC